LLVDWFKKSRGSGSGDLLLFLGMDQAVSQPGYRSGTCKEQRDRYEVGHDGRSGLMVKVHAFLFAWPYNILGHPFLV